MQLAIFLAVVVFGLVLLGAGMVLGGVILGGYLVYRTKREPHEPFMSFKAPEGDAWDADIVKASEEEEFDAGSSLMQELLNNSRRSMFQQQFNDEFNQEKAQTDAV